VELAAISTAGDPAVKDLSEINSDTARYTLVPDLSVLRGRCKWRLGASATSREPFPQNPLTPSAAAAWSGERKAQAHGRSDGHGKGITASVGRRSGEGSPSDGHGPFISVLSPVSARAARRPAIPFRSVVNAYFSKRHS